VILATRRVDRLQLIAFPIVHRVKKLQLSSPRFGLTGEDFFGDNDMAPLDGLDAKYFATLGVTLKGTLTKFGATINGILLNLCSNVHFCCKMR
jgi:hypothetical protein